MIFWSNAKYFGQQREAKNDKNTLVSQTYLLNEKLEFFPSSEVNR